MEITGTHTPRAGLQKRLIYSTGMNYSPQYSRDGKKLAFVSNRTGPQEIWGSDAEGNNAAQLTNPDGPDNGTPRWSPDGSAIAFDSRMDGNREIRVASIEGQAIRQITHSRAEEAMPSWSNDGRWIYFASNRKGDFQIYKVSASTGESSLSSTVQVTTGGGFNAAESFDGQYLYFAKGRGKRGILRQRLNHSGVGAEEPVLDSLKYYGWWALGSKGIFFLEREEERPNSKVHLKFLDVESRKVIDLRTLPYPIWRPWSSAITISPDGHHLVFEQGENWNSNIVVIDNFR
jgi:dipeptidyl aminopeptidase/acylaminoacyl peptidase